MSGFRFRLAPLLARHKATRHERRAAMADVLVEERRLKARLYALRAQLDSQHELRRRAAAAVVLDPKQLAETHRYERALESELRSVEQSLVTIAHQIDQEQQALAAANSQVRGLETLRDAEQARIGHKGAARERNALDEAAAQSVTRKCM